MTLITERPAAEELSTASAAAGDSLSVAAWTLLSRVTGLVRLAATGAVLGPTVLGNTFQFTNTLPNLLYYGLLAGSLFSSLLVPALVQHIDIGDRSSSARVAGGFLGVTVVGLACVVPVAVALVPLLLGLTTSTVGADQAHTARLLFLMFVPQVFCYALVGTATATQNAHRRFGLAAAAPALENLGILVVLLLTYVLYDPGHVPTTELLLLGLGTTSAVAVHACVQWWGARRCGVLLKPTRGWRDPEVVVLLRRAVPSLGQAGLLALQMVAILTAANHASGGVVAFQIAVSFVFLAIALAVTPVALASLPRLARLRAQDELVAFHDTFLRGLTLALFLAVPAAVGFVVLAWPLARAVAVGRMSGGDGPALVAGCLIALAPGVVGQCVFDLCSYASYAQKDTRSPLRSAAHGTLVCLTGVGLSLALLDGRDLLVGLGASYSLGLVVAAASLARRAFASIGSGSQRAMPSVLRIGAAASVMAVPTRIIEQSFGDLTAAALGALAGLVTYLLAQAFLKTAELTWLLDGVGARFKRVAA